MSLLRWPIAAVVLFLLACYGYALVVVLPWWALLLVPCMWALIRRVRGSRRGPSTLGSERQTTHDA